MCVHISPQLIFHKCNHFISLEQEPGFEAEVQLGAGGAKELLGAGVSPLQHAGEVSASNTTSKEACSPGCRSWGHGRLHLLKHKKDIPRINGDLRSPLTDRSRLRSYLRDIAHEPDVRSENLVGAVIGARK